MKKTVAILAVLLLAVCLLSGCGRRHKWQNATCETPKICLDCQETEGTPLGHTWQDATCTTDQICTTCNKVGSKAFGHTWDKATCGSPRVCTICGVSDGTSLSHDWKEATATTPRMCLNCGEMQPMATPASGEVFIGKGSSCRSTLTIQTSSSACYIKLKDASGNDVYSFFVRSSDSATVPVPGGMFYVYFASGRDWYGPEYLFGPTTSYSKDDELSDYNNYAWEYTLLPTTYGNFSETPIDPEEF